MQKFIKLLIIIVVAISYSTKVEAQQTESALRRVIDSSSFGLSVDMATPILNSEEIKFTRFSIYRYFPTQHRVVFWLKAGGGLINIHPTNSDNTISEYFFSIKPGIGYNFIERQNFFFGLDGFLGRSVRFDSEPNLFEWDVSIRISRRKNSFVGVGFNKIYLIGNELSKGSIFFRFGAFF